MLAWSVSLALAGGLTSAAGEPSPYNVLLIMVDDLRPDLGCYGHPLAQTPHLDRLAASGTLFRRAYCQQAVCNPSRVSLLTGLRPETAGVTDLPTKFRDQLPDVVTLPEHFKAHGYQSVGLGKIFHLGHGNGDDRQSWSRRVRWGRRPRYGPAGARLEQQIQQAHPDTPPGERPKGPPWEAPEVADDALVDGEIARNAADAMRSLRRRPFFLAVGFLNPHLPFVAPKKYWRLYDPAEIRLATNPHAPEGAPLCAGTDWRELRRYHSIPQSGPLSDEQARQAIHGYLAAISYVDAQIGLLLDELDRLDLRRRTIVVVCGDHGMQLGEHGYWSKHTNYEVAVRAPLIVSAPRQRQPGAVCERVVELLDIFPTLTDLCGLPSTEAMEGRSLAPLLDDPQRSWNDAAFHLFPRDMGESGSGMGRAIRTSRYRLVKWSANDGSRVEYELYDLQSDPDENYNLAGRPEQQDVLQSLEARLDAETRRSADAARLARRRMSGRLSR